MAAYSKFSERKIRDYKEAERAVKRVKYIPVDVATEGARSRITKTGQKIVPGPIPQKAAQNAAKNDKLTIIINPLFVDLKSPLTNT